MNQKRYPPSSYSFISATIAGITLFATGISATAQGLVSGPDRLVNRVCTISCQQEREQLAFDSLGNAISIWAEEDRRIVTAAFHAATGTWAAPVTRFTGELVDTPEITMDGNGNALAIWATSTADFEVKQVWFARYISAQGSW